MEMESKWQNGYKVYSARRVDLMGFDWRKGSGLCEHQWSAFCPQCSILTCFLILSLPLDHCSHSGHSRSLLEQFLLQAPIFWLAPSQSAVYGSIFTCSTHIAGHIVCVCVDIVFTKVREMCSPKRSNAASVHGLEIVHVINTRITAGITACCPPPSPIYCLLLRFILYYLNIWIFAA